jgi:hypothetical protein
MWGGLAGFDLGDQMQAGQGNHRRPTDAVLAAPDDAAHKVARGPRTAR